MKAFFAKVWAWIISKKVLSLVLASVFVLSIACGIILPLTLKNNNNPQPDTHIDQPSGDDNTNTGVTGTMDKTKAFALLKDFYQTSMRGHAYLEILQSVYGLKDNGEPNDDPTDEIYNEVSVDFTTSHKYISSIEYDADTDENFTYVYDVNANKSYVYDEDEEYHKETSKKYNEDIMVAYNGALVNVYYLAYTSSADNFSFTITTKHKTDLEYYEVTLKDNQKYNVVIDCYIDSNGYYKIFGMFVEVVLSEVHCLNQYTVQVDMEEAEIIELILTQPTGIKKKDVQKLMQDIHTAMEDNIDITLMMDFCEINEDHLTYNHSSPYSRNKTDVKVDSSRKKIQLWEYEGNDSTIYVYDTETQKLYKRYKKDNEDTAKYHKITLPTYGNGVGNYFERTKNIIEYSTPYGVGDMKNFNIDTENDTVSYNYDEYKVTLTYEYDEESSEYSLSYLEIVAEYYNEDDPDSSYAIDLSVIIRSVGTVTLNFNGMLYED